MMSTNALIQYSKKFHRSCNLVASTFKGKEVYHCDHWSRFQSSIMGFLVNFLVNCPIWAIQVPDLWLLSLCGLWTTKLWVCKHYQLAKR